MTIGVVFKVSYRLEGINIFYIVHLSVSHNKIFLVLRHVSNHVSEIHGQNIIVIHKCRELGLYKPQPIKAGLHKTILVGKY